MSPPTATTKPPTDPFIRGIYRPSPLASTLFVALRTLDPLLQYTLTTTPLLLPLLSHLITISPPSTSLSPRGTVLLSMSALNALKQLLWLLHLSREPLSLSSALSIGAANFILGAAMSALYLTTSPSPATVAAGALLYYAGLAVETGSELQRKAFKDDPANRGRPFTGGLFAWARHVNLGAYAVARAGYAVAAGGWVAGALVGGVFAWDFVGRAVGVLDGYCEGRYGEEWRQFRRRTRWWLIPGVY
ncbi:hypothetical protein EDC01DRAFT_792082 [Geopyxis carbonaria]|nr:hypothetical protein EDC01DRAFT_792082 [Geopyxis carbonaria]